MAAHAIEVEVDQTGRVRAVEPSVAVPAGRALLTPLGSRPPRIPSARGGRLAVVDRRVARFAALA